MSSTTISPAELHQAVARLPRVALAHVPTPLEEAPRLARQLKGPRIFLKRDDCTGLLFGGNKTRHNEFLFGEALKHKADVLVWGAGTQSNNCRQTAAACNKLGLDCQLVLTRAAHDDDIQGNLLLDHLMGARVDIVDAPMGPELEQLLLDKAEALRRAGRRPFVWDRVNGRPIAAVGYAVCLAEILEQMRAQGLTPTHIYCCSAGATGAGLALGKSALGYPGRLRLIAPIRWPWDSAADLAEIANEAAQLLDLSCRLTQADIDIRDDYIGLAYGAVTPAGREAIDLLARTEGVLLDPVYTGKAMAALIDDIRRSQLERDALVVFVHTGGAPAVFAYRDELMSSR